MTSSCDNQIATSSQEQAVMEQGHRLTWLERHRHQVYIWAVRPITERLARPLHRWTYWAEEPDCAQPRLMRLLPKGVRRFFAGLSVATWTHLCGHGLGYSFKIGCIYWCNRYAKRALNLL